MSLAFTRSLFAAGTETFALTVTPGARRICIGSPFRFTSTKPSHAANPSAATPTQFVPGSERFRWKRPSPSLTSHRSLRKEGGSSPGPTATENASIGRPSGATTRPVNSYKGSIITTSLPDSRFPSRTAASPIP